MLRSSRGLGTVLGLATLAVAAAPAEALTPKKHHVAARHHALAADARPTDFPRYVDTGSDYNPGTDNVYFSDTKVPQYILGPAWFQRWEDR